MKIHEYQAKEILKKFGVPVPRGEVAATVEGAVRIARGLRLPVVIKAQIHAGGRGKGGGIKMAKTLEEVEKHARAILGMKLVTPQTEPEGRIVKKILVAEAASIDRELYLGAVLDRANSCVAIIASAEGGVEIEEIARKNPEKILKIPVDVEKGVEKDEVRKMAEKLNLKGTLGVQFGSIMEAIYKTYITADCSLVEVNPLAVAGDTLVAVDAKVNLDDNALFRHPDYEALRDPDEEDPKEMEAKKFGLSYISLNGNIGCMVNGAGLAMATMDLIKLSGGEPANFLDVGGGATPEQVTAGFKIILEDPKVKAILVNIFGGIMRCDVIAQGIVSAAKEIHITVPVVVRLQGTNVDLGKKILKESGLNLISEDDLEEAARKAVTYVHTR